MIRSELHFNPSNVLAFTGSHLMVPAVRRPLVVAKSALVTPSGSALKKDSPIIMNGQVLHSITAERLELVRGMHDYMRDVVSCGTCPAPVLAPRRTLIVVSSVGEPHPEACGEVLAADGLLASFE